LIRHVEFGRGELAAGEQRVLVVDGEPPIAVSIECFVSKPPPPGLKPCAVCGSFSINRNEGLMVTADRRTFGRRGGTLIIAIADATGDTRRLQMHVSAETDLEGSSGAAMA
jgi:hypothetical protein